MLASRRGNRPNPIDKLVSRSTPCHGRLGKPGLRWRDFDFVFRLLVIDCPMVLETNFIQDFWPRRVDLLFGNSQSEWTNEAHRDSRVPGESLLLVPNYLNVT